MMDFARRASFHYLVGAGEQRRRHLDPERLRSLEVDEKLKLGRLMDRQVRRLGAGKNAPRLIPAWCPQSVMLPP
jgi:hypothetical protein